MVTLALAAGYGVAMATASTRVGTVLSIRSSPLGEILVSAGARALYHTSSEKRNVVRCTGSCATRWPPLVISARAKPIAGPGVTASLLGTVRRPDGRLQVTYDGLALYHFSGDKHAGDINGQGVDGIWHAIAPTGAVVTKVVTSPAKTGTGSPSNPSSSAGSGSSTDSGSSTSSGPSPGVNAGMWCAANPKSCVNGIPIPVGS